MKLYIKYCKIKCPNVQFCLYKKSIKKQGVKKMKEKFYLHEFKLYDGEEWVTFNIVAFRPEMKEIQVAITNRGKITVTAYELLEDENGYYFEYGCDYTKINVNDFEEVTDE